MGERYPDDCRRIPACRRQANAAAAGAHAAPTGTLTVSAPVRFGRLCVLPVPMAFLERHPKLDGRTPFVDRTATLIGEGIDLAVRIGHLPDPGYVARTVGAIRREVSAAPGFLRRHGFRRRRAACRAIASSIRRRPGPAVNGGSGSGRDRGGRVGRRPGARAVLPDRRAAASLQAVLAEFEGTPPPVQVAYAERRHAPATIRGFRPISHALAAPPPPDDGGATGAPVAGCAMRCGARGRQRVSSCVRTGCSRSWLGASCGTTTIPSRQSGGA
ncbi:LysR substrate-binding domain-containing protein [Burkholderia plantarii]|uniref:LysR substrate-binding domain-containing protein n=1 Tax=Burkholderia plantarii TaxID=41899 RepID=UPI00130EDE48|nr:LysR substrate-binding domain-containing protein [Burkholderia plantarii]